MLYLFHGSDTNKVRAKALAWVEAARKKAPDVHYVRLAPGEVTEESLRDALSMQGLFFSKTLVLIDDPFEEKKSADIVLGMLSEFADSPNAVALLAPKLIAARVKKAEVHAEKTFRVDAAVKASRGFNNALVGALSSRNGELLWKEIVTAHRAGDAPEMVHGLLHWKARELMKRGGGAWGERGARKLSRDLIKLLADSRGRDLELALALERFALSL
jgi:DNA polymerase III delta subunit